MSDSQEQAVIVRVTLSDKGGDCLESLHALEGSLIRAIEQAGVGEFDGNEVGQGELVLYMYGSNAENLFAVVEPVLRRSQLADSASVVVRYGPPGAACRVVDLGAN